MATLVASLAFSACQVDTTVAINLEEDLSGAVEVTVELDAAAQAALGDTDLDTSDIEDAGWDVSSLSDDDIFVATKEFADPQELAQSLVEVGGDPLVFSDWAIVTEERFGASQVRIEGHVELTGSIEQFGDDALAESLDGFRAGVPPLLREDEVLTFTVELNTEGFEWDSVEGLEGSDGSGFKSFSLGTGESVDLPIVLTSTTSDSTPFMWIIGGGLLVVLSGLVMFTRSRKQG